MKAVFKNYFATIRKHTAVAAINLFGLAAAFTALVLISMHVSFEFGYDRFWISADRLYRFESDPGGQNAYGAMANRNDEYRFGNLSPHIVSTGAYHFNRETGKFSVGDDGGNKREFSFVTTFATEGLPETLQLQITEGSSDLSDKSRVLIPESLADKIFGSESAVGKRIDFADGFYSRNGRHEFIIGGVYRDIPENSSIKNSVFLGVDDRELELLGYRNYTLIIRLDSPESKEEVEALISRAGVSGLPEGSAPHPVRLKLLGDIYFTGDYHVNQMGDQPLGNKNITMIFLLIAMLILCIAVINFFNFSVAQIPLRVHSINMQKILGSKASAIRMGMIIESVVFCSAAYLLASGVIYLAATANLSWDIDTGISLFSNPGTIIAGYTLAVATGAGVAMYPALKATSLAPAMTLKGSFGLSSKGRRMRTALIGFQYVISIGLILSAVFMNMQYGLVRKTELGFNRDHIMAAPVSATVFNQRSTLESILEQNPAISGISFAGEQFFGKDNAESWGRPHPRRPGEFVQINIRYADSNFIPTLGMHIYEGRNFSGSDVAAGGVTYKVILNRAAQKYYELEVGDRLDDMEIVGFVEDFTYRTLHDPVQPVLIINADNTSNAVSGGTAYMKVNSNDYRSLASFIADAVRSLDPENESEPYFLNEYIDNLYKEDSRNTAIVTFFSVLAIIMSLAGIFSLITFEIRFKNREIAIRKVFGSSVREILSMFNRSYIRIISVCFLIASPAAAYAMVQWLQNFTVRITLQWWVFAGVLLLVGVVTMAIVTGLSYRAANDNPVDSLKSE